MDVDGVIADLSTEWHNLYRRDYHDDWDMANAQWDVHKIVKPECGMKIYDYIEDPHIYDNVLPIKGALDAMEKLEARYRIVYVTHSTVGAYGAKYHWLKRYGLITGQDNYIECADKTLIDVDLLIDDKPQTVLEFRHRTKPAAIFTQPWNIKFEFYNRIDGWTDDSIKHINRILNPKTSWDHYIGSIK